MNLIKFINQKNLKSKKFPLNKGKNGFVTKPNLYKKNLYFI